MSHPLSTYGSVSEAGKFGHSVWMLLERSSNIRREQCYVKPRSWVRTSEFRIFVRFGWVRSSVLVDQPGFGSKKGQKFSFSGFGPRFGPFLAEQVRSSSFFEGFKWVRTSEVQFWWTNLGLSESELRSVKFEFHYIWVRSNATARQINSMLE